MEHLIMYCPIYTFLIYPDLSWFSIPVDSELRGIKTLQRPPRVQRQAAV